MLSVLSIYEKERTTLHWTWKVLSIALEEQHRFWSNRKWELKEEGDRRSRFSHSIKKNMSGFIQVGVMFLDNSWFTILQLL